MGQYKSTQIAASAITAPHDMLIEKLEKFTIHYGERVPQYKSAAIQKFSLFLFYCGTELRQPQLAASIAATVKKRRNLSAFILFPCFSSSNMKYSVDLNSLQKHYSDLKEKLLIMNIHSCSRMQDSDGPCTSKDLSEY